VNPVAVLRTVTEHATDGPVWHMLHIWCPGCDNNHAVNLEGPDGYRPSVCWEWDGNLEKPTISPSILCYGTVYLHEDGTQCPNWHEDYETETHTQGPCHSFVKAGQWQFLSDCAHMLADQTVDMVPLPDWLVNE
jgi:hypothetical protein